jgi:hypothetical protein
MSMLGFGPRDDEDDDRGVSGNPDDRRSGDDSGPAGNDGSPDDR